MRRRLYLLRHADVSYFADPDIPVAAEEIVLTPDGLRQAREAGRALARVRFDRVLTSGLPRTMETARLVVEQLEQPFDGPLEPWPDLQEFRPGEVGDVPDDKLEEAFLEAFRGSPPSDVSYLGGETCVRREAHSASGAMCGTSPRALIRGRRCASSRTISTRAC
jgi:broad specificity phosphatase PhoE